MSYFARRDGVLVLELHVQPGASRTEVAGLHGGRLKIRLAARAIDGRANEALIDFLARALSVPRKCVRIHAGARSIWTSDTSAAVMRSLSARGSISWPSVVICLRRRAK